MKVAFRVDASSEIGTGHFMRCLTLADSATKRGAEVRFISRHMPEHLREMLSRRRHEFVRLNSSPNSLDHDELPHSHWLGTSQAADARETLRALSGQAWDWLVVDHYALDVRWESVLRGAVKQIMVIDDLADREHDCDVLLDQNFYADMDARYAGKVPNHCRILLGPRYVLLREEFLRIRHRVKRRAGPVRRVLIFFGGVDADNYTGRAIEALVSTDISDLSVDVVIGPLHPCREQIQSECAQHGFTCHIQSDRMAELMATADLAIGASGSATWERCWVGLPTIVLVLAENQRQAAADLDAAGVLVNLGEAKQVSVAELARNVARLMADERMRRKLSRASQELVAPSEHKDVAEFLINATA